MLVAVLVSFVISLTRGQGTTQVTKTKPGEDNATLYHVFPHNQHLFQLPECASQQVCNAVYLRLNFSTPLCACPQQGDPCSASTLDTDNHSLKLSADKGGKVLTLAKTCEEVPSIRLCEKNRDWSILALQNIRTGKAHYLVICTCPPSGVLEGPLAQTGAPYAKVPGIRVYGMLCLTGGKKRRRKARVMGWGTQSNPAFPLVPQHFWEAVTQT
eukprot:TRINITY_DN21663_c0_g1_i1.p1 TRINITY_DN21663_c0_g1~~TRINITY_DN21663_c0_g1_i1.p1  ORF type:complete len:213 (-),score=61.87 TRINITY_DN21663_c0_g1_i1:257-895(-)